MAGQGIGRTREYNHRISSLGADPGTGSCWKITVKIKSTFNFTFTNPSFSDSTDLLYSCAFYFGNRRSIINTIGTRNEWYRSHKPTPNILWLPGLLELFVGGALGSCPQRDVLFRKPQNKLDWPFAIFQEQGERKESQPPSESSKQRYTMARDSSILPSSLDSIGTLRIEISPGSFADSSLL